MKCYSFYKAKESDEEATSACLREYKVSNNVERRAVYHILLQNSAYGKLKKDATQIVASSFSASRRTIQCLWKTPKDILVMWLIKRQKVAAAKEFRLILVDFNIFLY